MSFPPSGVRYAPFAVHRATLSSSSRSEGIPPEALCVGRDASVLNVAMIGLAQTIGFLRKFVKLNIRNHQFVQN
jgi:hypothetical protein